jgi:hypothetical protein
MMDCGMVAFVERMALGIEWTEEVVVVKSPDVNRFVDVVHPRGSIGATTESKCSTYRDALCCACATENVRRKIVSRLFMMRRELRGF